MALTSPIAGVSPDTGLFSNTATFAVPERTLIVSPIPGTAMVSSDKTITVVSPDGTKVEFKKVGTPSITNGSKVNIGQSIGYTGTDKMEFTAYNKGGSKLKFDDFIKNTDPATLALGAGATALTTTTTDDTDKDKKNKFDIGSYSGEDRRSLKDSSLFKMATGIGLAPFHLVQNAFGIGGTKKESEEERSNLIKEEVERIKKLMK